MSSVDKLTGKPLILILNDISQINLSKKKSPFSKPLRGSMEEFLLPCVVQTVQTTDFVLVTISVSQCLYKRHFWCVPNLIHNHSHHCVNLSLFFIQKTARQQKTSIYYSNSLISLVTNCGKCGTKFSKKVFRALVFYFQIIWVFINKTKVKCTWNCGYLSKTIHFQFFHYRNTAESVNVRK